MSITTHERFGQYPAIFDSLTLNHVRSVQPSLALSRMIIVPGGAVDPAIVQEAYRDPTVMLTSGDLGTILAAVSPVSGLAISSSSKIQYQQRSDGGTFAGSGNHFNLVSTKGFLVVERISADQDSPQGAEIAMKYWALRVGSTAPLVANASQSLTGSPAANGLYKLGPVVYEGSSLRGVQSTSIMPGITYETKRDAGQTSADVGSITRRNPTIEISGTNLALAAAVGFGRSAISSGLTVYYRKVGAADSDSVHISVTAAAGEYAVEEIPVSGEGDANARLLVTLTGTLSYSTTAQIP